MDQRRRRTRAAADQISVGPEEAKAGSADGQRTEHCHGPWRLVLAAQAAAATSPAAENVSMWREQRMDQGGGGGETAETEHCHGAMRRLISRSLAGNDFLPAGEKQRPWRGVASGSSSLLPSLITRIPQQLKVKICQKCEIGSLWDYGLCSAQVIMQRQRCTWSRGLHEEVCRFGPSFWLELIFCYLIPNKRFSHDIAYAQNLCYFLKDGFRGRKFTPSRSKYWLHFFYGKSERRTPEIYLGIRNIIMNKFHFNPEVHLESKDLCELSIGEMDARLVILEFLAHWGLVNFHPFPPVTQERKLVESKSSAEIEDEISPVDKLFQFETVHSYLVPVSKKAEAISPVQFTSLLSEPTLAEDAIGAAESSVEYHCNSCSVDCSRKCYHCRTQLYIVMSFGENKTGVAGQHRETAQQIGLNEIYVL
ncbi:unnamed protein product [Miscanthus lutarioriparius]|uniref:SWIRM domain-containing protein n=1 Tax=Miscanthus lutarioriparius TaxID=422564 RepID=A0A811R0I8_9POAL|nr:unnamed protein product [Miscanthus lutarioriparius]